MSAKSATKDKQNLHRWMWQLIDKTDNKYELLCLLLYTFFLGVVCYYNMILWSHFYFLFNGISLNAMIAYTGLLTLHLALYTLSEAQIIKGFKVLANKIVTVYANSINKKIRTEKISEFSHEKKYGQIVAQDIQTVCQEYLDSARRMLFGLIVVAGNFIFLIKQQLFGFMSVMLGVHLLVSLINYSITTGWSKNSRSLQKSVDDYNTAMNSVRRQADKTVEKATALSGLSETRSWECEHTLELESKRLQAKREYTRLYAITDTITRVYNRLQMPAMMGILLYLKKPNYPLPTAANATAGVTHIGTIYQSVQAVVQSRINLDFFYAKSDTIAKISAAYEQISKMAKRVGWSYYDIVTKSKNQSLSPRVLVIRQFLLAGSTLCALPFIKLAYQLIYPKEVWLYASILSVSHTLPLAIALISTLIGMSIYAYKSKESWWQGHGWQSLFTLSIYMIPYTVLASFNVNPVVTSIGFLLANIATIYKIQPARIANINKNKTIPATPATYPTNTSTEPGMKKVQSSDITLPATTMYNSNNEKVWELENTVTINPKGYNTCVIVGENGTGKTSLLQYIQSCYNAQNNQKNSLQTDRGEVYFSNASDFKGKVNWLENNQHKRLFIIPQKTNWKIEQEIIEHHKLKNEDGTEIVFSGANAHLAKQIAYRVVNNPVIAGSADEKLIADLRSENSKLLKVTIDMLKDLDLYKKLMQNGIAGESGGNISKIVFSLWAAATAIPDITGQDICFIADEPGHGEDNVSKKRVLKNFIEKFNNNKKCSLVMILHTDDEVKAKFNNTIELTKGDGQATKSNWKGVPIKI